MSKALQWSRLQSLSRFATLMSRRGASQNQKFTSSFQRTYASQATKVSKLDHQTDVLIVGSGAGSLVAALRARWYGLDVTVIEKTSKIGGSSAFSGGGLWIPNNTVSQEAGVQDSEEDAIKYMEGVIGDVPSSSQERKLAFLQNGPKMVSFLRDQGFRWRWSGTYPDYYPWEPGAAKDGGRCIESHIFDGKQLGEWKDRINTPPTIVPPAYLAELKRLTRMAASFGDFFFTVRIVLRGLARQLIGQRPLTCGLALVGGLLKLNLERKTCILTNSPLVDLIMDENGDVIGAVVEREGLTRTIRATKGVLLGAGGFAHNKDMRTMYMPAPASSRWTSTPTCDTGDAIQAAMKVCAATTLLDDAWWGPSFIDPKDGSSIVFGIFERSRPFSIVVDSSGSRFFNEAESYSDAGQRIYEHHQKVSAVPAWLILDWNHRKRYMFGTMLARQESTASLQSGVYYRDNTISGLASQIGIDPERLLNTITRFNRMARTGIDEDFGRGSNSYDNFFGDPKIRPNPNLGPIEKAPFYAIKIWPGDLGTKGGLLTDEHARVLDKSGKPITGLYATGNTTASVMGRRYPGAGATLGPAMTFGYIAVDHIAQGESQTK